jgi:type VI secretion system protein ImpA
MAPLDMTQELPDLEPEAPSGPNLELDAAFGELERAAAGTPERQAGDSIIPAEDPDWKEVAAQAEALLERSYDLRVLVHLAVARLHLRGLAEFSTVLGTIAQLLATRWDSVHPQLDPEDDNDPLLRANALLPLGHPVRVLRVLRTLTLATSQRAGGVSWRTIAILLGSVEAEDAGEKRTESEVRAAFADTPDERIAATGESIEAALAALRGIGAAFDANGGVGTGPNLDALVKLLADIKRFIGIYHTPGAAPDSAGPAEEAPGSGDSDATEAAPAPSARSASRGVAVTALSLSAVSTRAEALHLLDIACRYYEQNEPSSPLPLMIARARKLADKNFLEILQDLAPDGVTQAQVVVQSREGSSW